MIESPTFDEPLDELESLLLMAGGYVQASEDLRPRILEASRCQQRERKVRHGVRWGVLCTVFLSAVLASGPHDQSADLAGVSEELATADAEALLVPEKVERRGDASNWHVVDSFTALRRRHAEQLRSL